MALEPELLDLIAEYHFAALATIKRDGRPQLSVIAYSFDRNEAVVRISITADRAKYFNLSRDPRATLQVNSADWQRYVVAEGPALLSPVAGAVDDDTVDSLVEHFRGLGREAPDWDEFRRSMVADKRVMVSIAIDRVYGIGRR